MHKKNTEADWNAYRVEELASLRPILTDLGFLLEETQPHLGGERYLMQAVTTASGRKLILLGKRTTDEKRVVIKATRDQGGKHELLHERLCRTVLQKISFAYHAFQTPEELFFGTRDGYLISVQAFLEQECSFLERPLPEQFRFALRAFKAQEGAHATTYGHRRVIRRTFGEYTATTYLDRFRSFVAEIAETRDGATLLPVLTAGEKLLTEHQTIIEQYAGFLTHTDFVPHNFRIKDGEMYLLDYSSLRFGNKYEGWARFLNFMTLYNPPLEEALTEYVKNNRTPEESASLRLMRIYRLGEIIWYYTEAKKKSTGDLERLNAARVHFWGEVLRAVVEERALNQSIRLDYIQTRDSLRSEEEKKRQVGLH